MKTSPAQTREVLGSHHHPTISRISLFFPSFFNSRGFSSYKGEVKKRKGSRWGEKNLRTRSLETRAFYRTLERKAKLPERPVLRKKGGGGI